MPFRVKPVETDGEWEAARAIREQVFIEEQNCPPEEEWDVHDATSRHVVGYVADDVIATARWRTVPWQEKIVAKLERFAVRLSHRGEGYGRRLVEAVLADARRAGFDTFVLHAQAHLEGFYASFGFETVGAPFVEAGIRHVKMVKRAPQSADAPEDG